MGPAAFTDNEVFWSSTDWGRAFTDVRVSPPYTFADEGRVDDVQYLPDALRKGGYDNEIYDNEIYDNEIYDNVAILSSGAIGMGFAENSPGIGCCTPSVCAYDLTIGNGSIVGATLAMSGQQLVAAYWLGTHPNTLGYFWKSATTYHMWHGPFKLTDGSNARLVSGPDGLFLLSVDYTSPTDADPTRLSVRKWDPTTHRFGAPTTVVNDPPNDNATAAWMPGLAEDTATGTLYVAWATNYDAAPDVMRLWTSSNGGVSFSGPREIAPIDTGSLDTVRMAVTHGHGFLTFGDDSGLHLVDISPAAGVPFHPAAGVPFHSAASAAVPLATEQLGAGDQGSRQPNARLGGANHRAAAVTVANAGPHPGCVGG